MSTAGAGDEPDSDRFPAEICRRRPLILAVAALPPSGEMTKVALVMDFSGFGVRERLEVDSSTASITNQARWSVEPIAQVRRQSID